MKRYISTLLFIICLPTWGQDSFIIPFRGVAALVKTLDANQTSTDANRNCGAAGYYMAQSFKTSGTYTLNSIEINMLSTPTVTMVCRIGTSSNLTSYTEEITRTVSTAGASAWVSFTAAGTTTLTAGTTYYFGIFCTDGGPQVNINDAGGGGYADGSYYYNEGNQTWDCHNNVSTRDMAFKIYLNE